MWAKKGESSWFASSQISTRYEFHKISKTLWKPGGYDFLTGTKVLTLFLMVKDLEEHPQNKMSYL